MKRVEPGVGPRVDLAPEEVRYEDVDDVIGVAAELKQLDADRLGVADLQEVAIELGIEPKYVEQAIAELERRRVAADHAQRGEQQRARKLRLRAAVAAGALVVLFGVSSGVVQSGLRGRLGEAEQRRAQVKNVLERQKRVEEEYRGRPPGPERDAELSGAENRVRIERRRYDQAAAAYNTAAGGPFSGLCARLYGLPTAVPLSDKVTSW